MPKHRIQSIIWSVMDVALYPVIFMLSIPIFMNHLGDELFGIWMLVNALIVSGQLFSLGLGTATFRNVSKFIGNHNDKEISNTINSNIFTTFILGFVCLLCGCILIYGIQNWQWFNITNSYTETVSNCILIAAPLLVLKFIEQILQYTIKAYEKFVAASVFNIISRFCILGINLLLILSGYHSLTLLLICNVLFSVIMNVVMVSYIKRINSKIVFKLSFNKTRVYEEISFGWWAWIQSLLVIIAYQGDRFLVMSFFGPSKLAYYAIVSTMFNHIHMCFYAMAPWAFPQIAKMVERGENAPEQYFKIRSYIVMFSVVCLWLFNITNAFLLTAWLGPEKYAQIKEFVTLFICFEVFFVFTIVPYMYCNSSGHEKLQTKITLIYSLLNLAGMLLGCYITQSATGMIWGLVLTTLPGMMIQNAILNKRLFHQSIWQETIGVFLPSILVVIAILNANIFVQVVVIGLSAWLLYKLHYVKLFSNESRFRTTY